MCHITTLYKQEHDCPDCFDTGITYPRVETSDDGITFRLGVPCPACGGKHLNNAGVM